MLSHQCERFSQGGSTHTESKAFCFLRILRGIAGREIETGLIPSLVTQVFRSRRDLMLENLALRQQLAVLKLQRPVPQCTATDRLFLVILRRLWCGWKQALIPVQPQRLSEV
jgi:hypothetical protein